MLLGLILGRVHPVHRYLYKQRMQLHRFNVTMTLMEGVAGLACKCASFALRLCHPPTAGGAAPSNCNIEQLRFLAKLLQRLLSSS